MRLTKRDSGGNARKNCEDCEIKFRESCCSKQLCLNALIEKLAAYEDTGYSPIEIKSLEGEWNTMRKVVDFYRTNERRNQG
jgi:hypothetical protein